MSSIRPHARSTSCFVALLTLLVVFTAAAPSSATPEVQAKSRAYGCTEIVVTATDPDPLEATAFDELGGSSAYAYARPGVLKASASIANTGGFDNSYAEARFTDHFFLNNGNIMPNALGTFRFNMVLTGTLRINANYTYTQARVCIWNYTAAGGAPNAQLNFERIDGVPTLYARGYEDGGMGFAERNMLAGDGGEMVVYGQTTSASGGYYTMNVRIVLRFEFPQFPINWTGNPLASQLTMVMGCSGARNAISDFSSTFEFAEQNPITPSPADLTLPTAGWTFDTETEEITLPAPLTVTTFTATGDAAFVSDDGIIENLTAVDPATAPAIGRPAAFPHGMFSLQVTGLEAGAENVLTLTLPDDVEAGTKWWFADGTSGWRGIDLGDDDGDRIVTLTLTDGLLGDIGGEDGILDLVGGPTAAVGTPTFLTFFSAVPRGVGVDLSWRLSRRPDGDFLIRAHNDESTWTVAHVTGDAVGFTARDESPQLVSGGTVTYELLYNDIVLESRRVQVTIPARQVTLTGANPNPFNPLTDISFAVARAQEVRVDLFTMDGRRVASLADRFFETGSHVLSWDGRDDAGRAAPSGTYLVLLRTENGRDGLKIMLVR